MAPPDITDSGPEEEFSLTGNTIDTNILSHGDINSTDDVSNLPSSVMPPLKEPLYIDGGVLHFLDFINGLPNFDIPEDEANIPSNEHLAICHKTLDRSAMLSEPRYLTNRYKLGHILARFPAKVTTVRRLTVLFTLRHRQCTEMVTRHLHPILMVHETYGLPAGVGFLPLLPGSNFEMLMDCYDIWMAKSCSDESRSIAP
ncbi:hypothetical protein F5X99DRAFT_387000 [Biscogniauxia marginata]|nr:hypothetical protein F5X99DRAFT_387000 [Biscogniauxia marginata]